MHAVPTLQATISIHNGHPSQLSRHLDEALRIELIQSRARPTVLEALGDLREALGMLNQSLDNIERCLSTLGKEEVQSI